ncbi:hypothetical protein ADK60_29855 [Streptomyces sp. XY431]|nr:hypothetical protein ADK60_29855 [Streptomyces sp. XY431]
MLFGAPVCAVCATELLWGGKGRRPKYCSKACSSKADRAREKEKQTRALAEAAETTRGETRLPAGLPDGLADDPAASELLTLSEELAAADRLLLHRLDRAARDTDPALAHKALAAVLDAAAAVTRRHRELVERLRAGHPALADASEQPTAGPRESPRGEIATVHQVASGTGDARSATAPAPSAVTAGPGAADASAGESLRGETTAAQGTLEAVGAARPAGFSSRDEKTPAVPPGTSAPVAPREETPTAADVAGPAPVTPRGENTTGGAAAAGPASADANAPLRTAVADPYARFGASDRLDDLAVTFGAGWELATWSAPGVRLLLHDGTPKGWTCRLPDGSWGLGGWITVEHQGDGRPGRFVADRFGRPRTFPTADLALDVLLLRAAASTTLSSAPAPAPAAASTTLSSAPAPAPAAADGVPVPDLALATAAGRTPPTLRGLGDPHRDYALGDGLVHLTWPSAPTVQALEHRGRLAGWVEVYDEDGNWIALVSGRPVADAADNIPLLSANPADALTLLRLALDQGLAAAGPARPLPPVHG